MTERAGLDTRLRAFLDDFGGVAGSVHLVHRDDLLLAAGVNLPGPLAAAVAVIPRGKGMAGTAWVRGEPVRTCDLKTDTAGGVVRPGARAVGAGAAVALPVRGADDEVIAVVGIAFDDERDIPEYEIQGLSAGATAILAQTAAHTKAAVPTKATAPMNTTAPMNITAHTKVTAHMKAPVPAKSAQ